MSTTILLACDLDRTVLPNGPDNLSDGAFDKFTSIVKERQFILTYMTGRSLESSFEVLREYNYPFSEIFSCDCGTSLYFKKGENYEADENWKNLLKKKWKGITSEQIILSLNDINYLKPQEVFNQNKYKASFYIDENIDKDLLKRKIHERLSEQNIEYEVVISTNHIEHFGYLDIIPKNSMKGNALKYIQHKLGIENENVIYAGDSGNDLEPLTMGYKSIVVNNASEDFKSEVRENAKKNKILDSIYFAIGNFDGLNGNYISGILEGLNYFRIYPKVNA